jgi:peptidoglycan/xylan/chitin deacetylase (PgdA/CDA1 family)
MDSRRFGAIITSESMLRLSLAALLACFIIACQASDKDAIGAGHGKAIWPPRINTATLERDDPYWKHALEEVYRSPEEIKAQDEREQRRGQFLPKLIRGNPKLKLLALTFDDGPHPGKTEALLDLLKREHVRATFFVIGKMVERNPNLLRRMAKEGHLIANHTFSHVTLTKIPEEEVEVEYKANIDIVKELTGKTMRYCRPPGGDYDASVVQAAATLGMTTVLWTDDPGDYANPGDEILQQRTLDRLSNGGIILLHDGIKETMQILPKVIEYAKKQGFKFVTVDQLSKSLGPKEKMPEGLARPHPANSSSVSG